jgi:hypothetical protein
MMNASKRRNVVRKHKETITVWRVQARLDGWSDGYVANYSDFDLALMLERFNRLPNLDIDKFNYYSKHDIQVQTK